MALKDITTEAVSAAIVEFDRLGADAFLRQYGFKDANAYWITANGRRYPSKAIAGVAHKFIDGKPLLGSKDFTGGEASVGRKLRQLGFEVTGAAKNPSWTRDEIILALDAYVRFKGRVPAKDSEPILSLSALLNRMHKAMGTVGLETIRNSNGVYLKLMNLRSLDASYTAQGKVGMQSGGKLERLVWQEFDGRPEELKREAERIRAAIEALSTSQTPTIRTDEIEGEEGGVVLRLHKQRERDGKLVAAKRAEAKLAGKLRCEVCSFDFGKEYGSLGADYVEVHHIKPVHTLKPGSRTKLTDLALLCANCHRMAHRRRIPLTLDELRQARGAALSSMP